MNHTKKKGDGNMLLVSITGASLITMGLLQKKGFSINEDMMILTVKLIGFGAIVWLIQIIRAIFLF